MDELAKWKTERPRCRTCDYNDERTCTAAPPEIRRRGTTTGYEIDYISIQPEVGLLNACSRHSDFANWLNSKPNSGEQEA